MNATLSHETRAPQNVKPNPRNARTHSRKQILQIANSLDRFGFINPILIDENEMIIAGHGRSQAAELRGLAEIPVIVIRGLTDVQKRELAIADNKIASNSGWDKERLALELQELIVLESNPTLMGFDTGEIEMMLIDHVDEPSDPADEVPAPSAPAVSKLGDLWLAGNHRIGCGDACDKADVEHLCGDVRAAMVITDVPYNRSVRAIGGRGKKKHQEFAMASGEMSPEEFNDFLALTLANAVSCCSDRSLHYVFMDWRGIHTLLSVGDTVYRRLLNVVVWVKANGGQGSFYRSQHEFIAVFAIGDEGFQNNIEQGKHGRNRTNVWHFAGVNSFRKGRLDDLTIHPTVKPVAMIAEAIKDCTRRGDYVLDIFGGSGTALLACEKVGRRALLLEIEPAYVDVTIERWQRFTGKDAIHGVSGKTFDEARQDVLNGQADKEAPRHD